MASQLSPCPDDPDSPTIPWPSPLVLIAMATQGNHRYPVHLLFPVCLYCREQLGGKGDIQLTPTPSIHG